MDWQQLHLQCAKQDVELAETLLLESGALSISLEDAGDQPLFEPLPGQSPLWDEVILTGLFSADNAQDIEALAQTIAVEVNASRVWTTALADTDWEREWMSHYVPIECTNNLWIVPKWMTPPNPDAINIMMDPGLAFGTGYHATTRLCLDWLTDQDLKDKVVIDYGCGSGILGIAALLLGAKQVYSVDIDPQAVLATKQNAERNQVNDQLEAFLPDDFAEAFSSGRIAQADIITANILAKPLMDLAPYLATLIKPAGGIVLAGLISEQLEDVKQAYSPWFNLDGHHSYEKQDDAHWHRLSGTLTVSPK
ncbi:50S ribosomal protein L11 methyltransferase [Psychrobacter sp. FDAARGOS_221]|uniref:50S ribosomal protein L11 methyltransferase n=1 Tax=Psychrobacter sp. FDAARGOS_221 TaxID=1975705 RepID=UPI000BB57E20|nr:50S ribosomal protein L11 methyltransferase [Psychrobacter sp. FDAARGOS_221]PNK59977.1 50S ribosomal protein L11 methyltransferase [Psychrobacter sp. FDAARGOS_221]